MIFMQFLGKSKKVSDEKTATYQKIRKRKKKILGSVKKFVSLVKNNSFLVKIKI